MPEKIEVTTNLLNAVLQYLGSKPYAEVAQLIAGIQQEAAPQLPQPEVSEEV